jgi:hypothetical protein
VKALVDRSLRIRLEGRVERLERALAQWKDAVAAARHRDFTAAAYMLECGEVDVPTSHDAGLQSLAANQEKLRRELESLVQTRLRMFEVPAIDLARGARWLANEPARYEHHLLTFAFFRVLVPNGFFLFPLTALSFIIGGPVAAGLLAGGVVTALVFAARHYGWSDVVLTDRRMLIDGRTIDLRGVTRVIFVKTIDRYWPSTLRIQFWTGRRVFEQAQIRHAPDALRAAFRRIGLEVDFALNVSASSD